ncbi:hypothetical protein LOZ53_001374 [Ophidiomyces ophidiicola]|nr:hypothetical protein LOZ53_001374 [Ophidiomyces ophidiicola]KAI1997062.1 hypothetical protein LOZ51_003225 [Ophidiomyces ophidiicola]
MADSGLSTTFKTDASQDIEMADGPMASLLLQSTAADQTTSAQASSIPAPVGTSSGINSQTYPALPAISQSATAFAAQINIQQSVGNALQQIPTSSAPTSNDLSQASQPQLLLASQPSKPSPAPPAPSNPQMHMGTISMAIPSQQIAGYYSEMPSNPQNSDGYELISDGGGAAAGGRMGKKDVKRRTKTGCLTCRKRRIKCDERHPICRNCEKSKRECLGYDPVFRAQPGPSVIQPAPSQQTTFPVAAPQIPPPVAPPSNPVHLVSAPPSNSPSIPATLPTVPPAPPAPAAAPQRPEQRSQATSVSSTPAAAPSPSVPPAPEKFEHLLMANAISECRNLELHHINIDDLLTVSGRLEPLPEGLELSATRVEECAKFVGAYLTCIDVFLETHWYETGARPFFLANKNLLAHVSIFLDYVLERRWNVDPDCVPLMESREARFIWDAMALCLEARAQNKGADGKPKPEDPELTLAINRFKVVEALLTGKILTTNPTSAPEYGGDDSAWLSVGLGVQLKRRQMKFWDAMGQYLVIADDMPECNVLRDLALMDARSYLDTFEGRDTVYSIAVIRHISRFQPRKVKNLPPSTDEKDVSAKLYVATKFIEEEKDAKGTSQVVRRLCGQLFRWWEKPENL